MYDFDHAFMQLHHNPTPEQIRGLSLFDPSRAATRRNWLSKHMLRLYKLLGFYSRNIGGRGVYEPVHRKIQLNEILKFYLKWAEQCGKDQDLEKFREVLQKARSNSDS
ncbi:hypothetical protein GCK72_022074 [Caenorhabditis remanei]|uniref:Uncharacterized protein n=1 Tax=Caenorhabditis remanei TaxID=31234 RepID=A0A6A5FSS3_CAERE|nr:hypothetical protein GCK72_022074 [Caenorhabditis remanei]KAF1745627.1 hypothetical protein GCK72_022074 [Caenorhabditis remanei]